MSSGDTSISRVTKRGRPLAWYPVIVNTLACLRRSSTPEVLDMRTRITFHCPLPKLSSQPWSCQASLLERWVITLAHRRLQRTAAIGWNGQWNFVRVDRRTSSSTWRSLQDHLGLRNGQPDGGGYVLHFRIVFTHASKSSMRCLRSEAEGKGVPFSGGGRPEEYTAIRLGND